VAGPALRCGWWDGDTLCLPVRVQTRARRLGLGAVTQGRLKLLLTAPPVDGKANAQARDLLARCFGVGVSRVELAGGRVSRDKLFRVTNPPRLPDELISA
jgi:uncharacterized protein (TIGR00251 family)